MRIAILILLTVVCAAGPAISQVTDHTLIVPGVRLGKWTLAMAIEDIERMNGPAHSAFFPKGSAREADAIRDFREYSWSSLGITAITFDGHRIEVLATTMGGRLVPYTTDKGIGLQSSRAEVLKAYGAGTVETTPQPGQTTLIYDEAGVAFRVAKEGGRVLAIYVFRPGTARRFWQCSVAC